MVTGFISNKKYVSRIDVNGMRCHRELLVNHSCSSGIHIHFHLQLSSLSLVRAATARLPFGYVICLTLMTMSVCVCTSSVTCTTYHHYKWFLSLHRLLPPPLFMPLFLKEFFCLLTIVYTIQSTTLSRFEDMKS